MKVALIGASGYVGAYILNEALRRGHKITAIVRYPDKISQHPNLVVKQSDILQSHSLTDLIFGNEAVISAFSPGNAHNDIQSLHLKGIDAIIAATKLAGIKRLLIVGGAGSLEIAPGVQLVDTPDFPSDWKANALATRLSLTRLEQESELEWTFLSPSAILAPGERTGKFRLGNHQLLKNAEGESKISNQDYAVAMIDELEKPRHIKQRFTVGY